jgi:Ca-activated chloride channel homolog
MTSNVLPLIDDDIDAPASTTGTAVRPGCGELRAANGDPLPLKALTVEADIVGLTATSCVRQRFVNNGTAPIEATYIFPLPPRAGVTDFTATVGGRRVVGILKERGRARMEYEEALQAGQRAAMVEEERSGVFTVRVGNLGPGEEAVVELVLTGPLEVQGGEATFRFPLVVAPRYTTGPPLTGDQTGSGVNRDTTAVPDSSRVTPPRLNLGDIRPELSMVVAVHPAGLSFMDFRSSLQSTVVESTGDGKRVVRLQPGDRADRDFLLRFRLGHTALATSAVVVGDGEVIEGGTWSVTVIPPVEAATDCRDVVVVLDRSGSMRGWKMVAARRAAGRIVDTLDIGDRFCVLGFDDRIDHPAGCSALVEASDRNRFAAASWLGSLEARGGTEMAQPLLKATHLLTSSGTGRSAVLVLVTDGQITGEDHLLRSLEPRLGATTVHCVGVDRAVNAGFLDRLARQGRGTFQLVESEDRLDQVMATLARTIGRPALSEINISGHGIDIIDTSITPTPTPDAFAGLPCVVSGRYRGAVHDETTLTVTAVGPRGPHSVTLVPLRSNAAAVRTIWSRAALSDLEDAYYATGQRDMAQAARQIIEHSIRFGVLSRFTAYVAIDPEHTDADALDEIVQPVEMTSGWDSTDKNLRGLSLTSKSSAVTSRSRAACRRVADRSDIPEGLVLGEFSAPASGLPDLDLPIEDLDLSERPQNCLKRAQVNTIGELVLKTEDDLFTIANFGQKSLDEVLEKLDERGLSLRSAGPTSLDTVLPTLDEAVSLGSAEAMSFDSDDLDRTRFGSAPRSSLGAGAPGHASGSPLRSLGSIGDLSLHEILNDLETLLANPRQLVTDEVMPTVRSELEAARDRTDNRELQVALTRLCEALDTYMSSQGAPSDRDLQTITEAIDNVRMTMPGQPERITPSKQRFWE